MSVPGSSTIMYGNIVVGPGTPGSSGTLDSEVCSDTTMPPPFLTDHGLSIDRVICEGLSISGVARDYNQPAFQRVLKKWTPSNRNSTSIVPALTSADPNYWRTRALANVNPNKPKFDLPQFIFEMKDFPRMLKQLGDILKDVAKASSLEKTPEYILAMNFGWAPLISDLGKLLDFRQSLEERKAELRAMEYGTHLKRSLGTHLVKDIEEGQGYFQLWEGVAVSDCIPGQPSLCIITAGQRTRETHKVWYTTNAKLVHPLPESSLDDLALVSALGLGIRPELIWNMVPWSFLIDYFANVGDVLSLYGGAIPHKVTRMNLMISRRVRAELVNIRTAPKFSISGSGTLQRTNKSRYVYANPTPSLSWTPLLTGAQMLNLASLSTSGALKAHR